MARSARRTASTRFNVQAFLNSTDGVGRVTAYPKDAVIYAQGAPADSVMYLQKGNIKLSVVSSAGKEAVIGMLGPREFFGEGCLAGQPRRMGTATARSAATVVVIGKRTMRRLLHEHHALSDVFIAKVLARNIRIEEDLIDQLFNRSEKRLARTLLRLACYGQPDAPATVIPTVSQETLAEIVGTTRSRINVFMQKFRKMGFIDDREGLRVKASLLSVVLGD
ncbi:MAG: Crp/Fnr family transcriptional regulator [Acidobacteriota bacterium]|nr:Crp/Fnr family transcriptional regulator [Acidobacteriota bacterium]